MTYSESHRLMSRRAWLGSAGLVAAAAPAGALVALIRPDAVSGHPPGRRTGCRPRSPESSSFCMASMPPIRADPTLGVRLAPLRADHTAHLQLLQGLSGRYGPTPSGGGGPSATAPTPTPTSVAGVRQRRACGLAGDSRSGADRSRR